MGGAIIGSTGDAKSDGTCVAMGGAMDVGMVYSMGDHMGVTTIGTMVDATTDATGSAMDGAMGGAMGGATIRATIGAAIGAIGWFNDWCFVICNMECKNWLEEQCDILKNKFH